MNLTRRQQDIYDHLRQNYGDEGYPLSMDDLCQELGLSSRGSLHKHIQALVKAGLIEPLDGKQRGIRLIPDQSKDEGVPFLGTIAAGLPIAALPQPESMVLPDYLKTDKPCYILKVAGDSMIEEGILDGDFVVIEQRDHASNGEIVVALIDNEEATLKRIEQTRGKVILHPANSAMKKMTYAPDVVKVQGVLTGQMRLY